MVKDYYDRVAGRVTSDINHFSGGLNTYYDKAFIEDNQLPYAINVRMITPPMLETRPGRYEYSVFTDLEDVEIRDLWAYDENEFYVIAYYNGNVDVFRFHRQQFQIGWQRENLTNGNFANAEHYCFCYVKQEVGEWLYISTDFYKCKIPVGDYYNVQQTKFFPLLDGYYGSLSWHKDRMFCADPEKNIISYSVAFEPDNFTPDPQDASRTAGDIPLYSGNGNIVAIKSFDDKLVVFCEHSMHALYGSTPDVTLSTRFQMVDLDNDLGAVAEECIAIGSGRLFFLGSNQQIYEYTGSSITMISRPSDKGEGGIDNLIPNLSSLPYSMHPTMASTYDKLYININVSEIGSSNEILFVFDIFNRTWWCEDGEFISVADYNSRINKVLLATEDGRIMVSDDNRNGYDRLIVDGALEIVPIQYIFQTKVFGATSVAGTKSIESIWLQARANADVYLNEVWTLLDLWRYDGTQWTIDTSTKITEAKVKNFPKIGTLKYLDKSESETTEIDKFPTLDRYKPLSYEQQVCYIEKMFGQRVNTFSVVVKGEGKAQFYLMQRKWRINENI